MNRVMPLCVVLLFLLHFGYCRNSSEGDCERETPRALGINVVSRRNRTGKWVTQFSAYKDDTNVNETNDISLELTHTVADCKGKRTVLIRGIIAENAEMNYMLDEGIKPKKILFHHKCGTNVAVMNNGRTLQKINLDEGLHSVAYTNRPLKDNELFEVTLDKKNNKFGNSLAIGVTPFQPTEISIPIHINHFPHPSWALYHSHVYQNGKEFLKNYGKNLDALEGSVGSRIGVMRSNTGTLHFYVNGVDQGPAASNIPNPVYGLLELWRDAAMATVVDSD